jgi:RNA polymerase sigma-70 factor (ECF subfamily)
MHLGANPKLIMAERVNTYMGSAPALDLDAQLMLRVKDGDEESFRILLEKYRNPVIHFVYRMVQDRAVSEEISQEVFLRVYRSRANYEVTARFTTWLFRIATRLALNWLRDGRRERGQQRIDNDDETGHEIADRHLSVEQFMLYETTLQEVRDAISLLPAKQRAAVLMHKYEEMEYSQIATMLECSESSVKSLLFRAYETLRARLAHMNTGVAR